MKSIVQDKIGPTHEYLVSRASTWLWSQGHSLVFSEMASCAEVPDAIGFIRNQTVVVECKISRQDFHRDRKKYLYLVNERGHSISLKTPAKYRESFANCPISLKPNMGSQRYYLSIPEAITEEMVKKHHPDHGLLHIHGKKIMKVIEAPTRSLQKRDLLSEAVFLQFAMRHLLGNLAGSGIKIDLLKATKMFGKEGIDLHSWCSKWTEREISA